jgi:hypothetical protein
LVYWFIGLLVYWFIGLLVYWFIGLLVYWFIGLLVYWFALALNRTGEPRMRFSAVIAATLALASSRAEASVIFDNFQDVRALKLVGKTKVVQSSDGYVLRLVPDAGGQCGAVFLKKPFRLGSWDSFTTQFQFRVTSPPRNAPSDGFTFFLAKTTHRLGSCPNGHSLDYQGLPDSIAVAFDTYYDSGTDAAPNLVAVDLDGDIDNRGDPDNSWGQPYHQSDCKTTPTPAGCLSDGQVWTVTVTYNGGFINVTVQDGAKSPVRVVKNYALKAHVTLDGDTPYVGFTAATGFGYANFDILNWKMYNAASTP